MRNGIVNAPPLVQSYNCVCLTNSYPEKILQWKDDGGFSAFRVENISWIEEYSEPNAKLLEVSSGFCPSLPGLCEPILSKMQKMGLEKEISQKMAEKELEMRERSKGTSIYTYTSRGIANEIEYWGKPRTAQEVMNRLRFWSSEVQQICCGIEALSERFAKISAGTESVTVQDANNISYLQDKVRDLHDATQAWLKSVSYMDFGKPLESA
jgi:hypothetical protein